MRVHHEISVKGKMLQVPAIECGDSSLIIKGKLLKIAEIFDEFWIEKQKLPQMDEVLKVVRNWDHKPDIFTFAQRVPDSEPIYNYPIDWINYAVIPLSNYEQWFKEQISPATRRNIKASVKKKIEVRVCAFDEDYVRGIMSIYNESPMRQGREYWHYGKNYDAVYSENGTYCGRSTYLGAYYQREMIGYLKVVWDESTAAIMQILSKIAFYDKRPNNALLSFAVQECCTRGIKYLIYENFVYGKKISSTLTEFKKSNGFVRMDLPRYYIPISLKGIIALKAGLHKNQKERLPLWLTSRLADVRTKWLNFQYGKKHYVL